MKEVAGIAFLFPTSHRSVWTGSIHCSSRCTWHCHSDHRQGLGSVAWEAPVPPAPWHSPTVAADQGAGTLGTGHHFCSPGCFYTKPQHTVSSGNSVLIAAHLCAALFSWKILKHIVGVLAAQMIFHFLFTVLVVCIGNHLGIVQRHFYKVQYQEPSWVLPKKKSQMLSFLRKKYWSFHLWQFSTLKGPKQTKFKKSLIWNKGNLWWTQSKMQLEPFDIVAQL